ncbi:uncharacterized protein LOC106159931 [Lingula anatina]|uniref:Uncharacterized protein LOC106159931 n=1 Tax=Lingula anatina TaxID=7574 RepID=A0A1S3I0Q1_LINAN|nr:uncharacterized protein LOC106159931 [Lingula anatina]|eukprot:XP_013391838.1 uncharacterized protein LOC106159931 [Lingula anatina]
MWDCHNCLQTLCDASFLEYDAASETYAMHNIIQAFAQNQTSQENLDRFRATFLAFMEHLIDQIHTLAIAEKGRGASTFFEKDRDNLLACIGFFEALQPGSKKATYNITKKIAFSLRQIGRFTDSIRCFKQLLKFTKEQGQQTENSDLAFFHYNIGYLQGQLSDPRAAVENLSIAIAEYEKQREGCDYKDYCKSCYNLALMLDTKEDYARCLDILKKCFDEATVNHDLSMQYLAQGTIAKIKARQGDEEAVMSTLHDILRSNPEMDGKENGVGVEALHEAAFALAGIGKKEEGLSFCRRAVAVAKHCYGDHPETAIVLGNLGYLMVNNGKEDGAIAVLGEAIAMRKKTLGDYQTDDIIFHLAFAKSALGNHEEALKRYQRALCINEQVLGGTHDLSGVIYAIIGFEMKELGNADGAVDACRRALAIMGECHEYTIHTMILMARALTAQGNSAEAISTLQRALHIQEKVLSDSQSTGSILHTIGYNLITLEDADSAVDAFRKALSMQEKVLGEYHEETAATLCSLGRAMSAQGKHAEALSAFQRALHIQEQLKGETHDTASTVHDIGMEMIRLHDINGATSTFRRVVAMMVNIVGKYHEETAQHIFLLATLLSKQGKHAEALKTFQRALRIQEQVLGESRQIADTLHCIGLEMITLGKGDFRDIFKRVHAINENMQGEYEGEKEDKIEKMLELTSALSKMGLHSDALNCYQKILILAERTLGESEKTATTLHYIGLEMLMLRNPNGDVGKLRRALAIRERTLGECHLHTADTLHVLSCALCMQEKHAEALSALQRSLTIHEKLMGESRITAQILHFIGMEMMRIKDTDGAVNAIRRALAMREKTLGVDHKDTTDTIFLLGLAISAQGNHAEALTTYQRALGIQKKTMGECISTATTLHCISHEMQMLGDKEGAMIVVIRAIVMGMKIIGKIPQ